MRDLIGYALYSLVGLVGIALLFSIFAEAEEDAAVEQLNAELMTLVTNVRKTHRGHPDRYGTTTITDSSLITAGIAPGTTIAGATNLRNAFGGDITVGGIASAAFLVTYSGVPREVCIQSLSRLRPDSGVLGVRVAASESAAGSATRNAFPVSFTTASTACANATNAIRIEAR